MKHGLLKALLPRLPLELGGQEVGGGQQEVDGAGHAVDQPHFERRDADLGVARSLQRLRAPAELEEARQWCSSQSRPSVVHQSAGQVNPTCLPACWCCRGGVR